MQTKDDVVSRALALGLIALRAQAEHGISCRQGEKDRYMDYGEKLLQWADEQRVDRCLSKAEAKLHRKRLGAWQHGEIAELFWRVESLKALLWALGWYEAMPSYFQVGDVKGAYAKIPANADVGPFRAGSRLRDKGALEAERRQAQFLNWRCRTELLRLRGARPPAGDNYEAVVARALDSLERDGVRVVHDGTDLLVDGTRFRELEGERKGDMMSVCCERHLALEWVCSEDDWDDAHADT